MITQKQISLKIDIELLQELDAECRFGWRKRNWHINEAIRMYLEDRRLNRYLESNRDKESRDKVVDSFIRRHIPYAVEW